MADSYALALQKGLVAALKANTRVSDLVSSRVYDEPPQGTGFPHLRIGFIEPRALRTDCKAAAIVTFSIEVHSRPNSGRVEATRIADAAARALNQQESIVAVAGFTLVRLHWITTNVDRDDDGQSYVGIVTFEAMMDNIAEYSAEFSGEFD